MAPGLCRAEGDGVRLRSPFPSPRLRGEGQREGEVSRRRGTGCLQVRRRSIASQPSARTRRHDTMAASDPARLCSLRALLATACCVLSGQAIAETEYCVVGASAFGCRSERDIAQVATFSGDVDSLRRDIATALSSGACRMFREGEWVFAVDSAGDLRSVRIPGDDATWWMPVSWSRPAGECAVYSSSRSIAQRIGIGEIDAQQAASAAPAEPPANAARSATAASCVIEPVMTDAAIAACRVARRR